jgi:hypothetical protein
MPLPQIVIDTNVIVAGLRSRRGSAFQLLSLIDTHPLVSTSRAGVYRGSDTGATKSLSKS